jgi:prepilin signal peptidase PulO-like enzyme (type II secretory pathway)
MFLNVFIITVLLNKLKGKRICYAVIILLVSFLLVNIFIAQDGYIISTATISSLVIFLFVIVLRYIGNRYNYKQILAKDIEEGMILSFETIFKFKTIRAKGLPEFTTENTDSRLSYNQVERIKKWAGTKAENETIKIVKNLPFAPFISVGTLIFVITRIYIILLARG